MKKGDKLPKEEIILRRVFSTDKRYIDPDGHPTSRAFKPREIDAGKLSVNAKSLTTYAETVTDPKKFKVFWLEVSVVDSIGLDCIYSPSRTNNSHSHIEGFPDGDEALAGLLARKSQEQKPF